jgi:hypothetical protein
LFDPYCTQALREELVKEFPGNEKNIGIIVADSMDRGSISALVKQTKVVLSTAGPFWK